ncbi:hypothetical protein ONZ45_g509 [Pleurotus djamor]|nr:hypothetical protein ONZ45_g509 [Pleurotus djamor]
MLVTYLIAFPLFRPSTDVSDVIVTGTFDQWSKSTHLNRTPTGFETIVNVPWGQRVQYKFLVDWQWRVLDGHPTEYDAVGNLNNVYVSPPKPSGAEEGVSGEGKGNVVGPPRNGSAVPTPAPEPEVEPSTETKSDTEAKVEIAATNGTANGDIVKSEPTAPAPADVTPTVPVKTLPPVDLPPAVPVVDEAPIVTEDKPAAVEEPTIVKPEVNGHVNGNGAATVAEAEKEVEEKKEEVVAPAQEPLLTPKTSPTTLPEPEVEPSTPKPSAAALPSVPSTPSSPPPPTTTTTTSSPAAAPLPPAPTSPPPSAPATPAKSPTAPTTPSKKHQRFPSMAGSTSGRSSVDSSPASSRFSTVTGEKDGSPRKKKGSIFKRLSSIFHHHHKDKEGKEEKVENGKH